MINIKYTSIIKDGWLHYLDRYESLTKGAKLLGVSVHKLKKCIESKMVIWEQPKNKKQVFVDINSVARLKHPDVNPDFSPLSVKDGRLLQKEIDIARHKIGNAANLPPAAIKICFDLGDGKSS